MEEAAQICTQREITPISKNIVRRALKNIGMPFDKSTRANELCELVRGLKYCSIVQASNKGSGNGHNLRQPDYGGDQRGGFMGETTFGDLGEAEFQGGGGEAFGNDGMNRGGGYIDEGRDTGGMVARGGLRNGERRDGEMFRADGMGRGRARKGRFGNDVDRYHDNDDDVDDDGYYQHQQLNSATQPPDPRVGPWLTRYLDFQIADGRQYFSLIRKEIQGLVALGHTISSINVNIYLPNLSVVPQRHTFITFTTAVQPTSTQRIVQMDYLSSGKFMHFNEVHTQIARMLQEIPSTAKLISPIVSTRNTSTDLVVFYII
jgi:hypothetical protein